jgi:dTDP-4-dehydrorhamnose reductase
MKILLLGCNGQLGWELQRSLAPLGEVVALSRNSDANPMGLCGDLASLQALAQTVRDVAPDVIVNAAAYTAVDRAETEIDAATQINALAPAVLAQEANKLGAWLVHYSTDYVFNGKGLAPWKEDDATGPLSVYGQSKLQGEQAISTCAKHLIFRTSWVYAAKGGNFAKTMIRLARSRDTLQVINDQFGAPTGADLLADITAHAIRYAVASGLADRGVLAGTYHVAAGGCTTWFDYAKYVLSQAELAYPAINLIAKEVIPVATNAFPTAAVRPLNSRLNTSKLTQTFGLALPQWQAGVQRMISEINYEQ